jgi:SAM-dependent methyltransferase
MVHTGGVSSPSTTVAFGHGLSDEGDLRLVGELPEGSRVVELGISDGYNAVRLALAGARAIAIDPRPDRVEESRRRAEAAAVRAQNVVAELADLGDITSSSCRLVLAVEALQHVDDLSRVLRQAHRILAPGMPLIVAVDHPFRSATAERPYGAGDRTIGEWFTALERTNFHVDQLLEPGASAAQPTPSALLIRARKQGS